MTKGRARAGTRTIQYMYRYSTTGTVLDLASTTVPICQPRPPRASRALLSCRRLYSCTVHVRDLSTGKTGIDQGRCHCSRCHRLMFIDKNKLVPLEM